MLIDEGKQFLLNTINDFWVKFNSNMPAILANISDNITGILAKINQIQEMFALIYKAILCAVGTAVKANLYS